MNRKQRTHDNSRNRKRAKLVLAVLSLTVVSLSAAQSQGQQPSHQRSLPQTQAEHQHLDAFGYSPAQSIAAAQSPRMRRLPSVKSGPLTPTIAIKEAVSVVSSAPAVSVDCGMSGNSTNSRADAPRLPQSFLVDSPASTATIESKPSVTVVSQKRPSKFAPQTPIAVAARRLAAIEAERQHHPVPMATRWLQSITTSSCSERATELLDDSFREYSVSAWASAESSSWEALELIARGIDVADRRTAATNQLPKAVSDLQSARTAIREARDFVASGGGIDTPRMEALVASHQTPVLAAGIPAGMTPAEAADRYLDHARKKLAGLASASVQAAKALDLLAAIGLARDKANWLPTETALCLRRAALQGQPSNSSLASRLGMQLADMGLEDEATWTLRHAISLDPDGEVAQALAGIEQRRDDKSTAMQLTADLRQKMPEGEQVDRIPDVIELSPSQFASISPAVNVGPSFQVAPDAQTQGSAQTSVTNQRRIVLNGPVPNGPVPNSHFADANAVDPGNMVVTGAQAPGLQQSAPQQAVPGSLAVDPPKKRRSFLPAALAGFRLGGKSVSDQDVSDRGVLSQGQFSEPSNSSYIAPPESAIIPDASAWSGSPPNAWASSSISQVVGQPMGNRPMPSNPPGRPTQTGQANVAPSTFQMAAPGSNHPGYATYPTQGAPAALPASAAQPSAMKRLMGKLPKLW